MPARACSAGVRGAGQVFARSRSRSEPQGVSSQPPYRSLARRGRGQRRASALRPPPRCQHALAGARGDEGAHRGLRDLNIGEPRGRKREPVAVNVWERWWSGVGGRDVPKRSGVARCDSCGACEPRCGWACAWCGGARRSLVREVGGRAASLFAMRHFRNRHLCRGLGLGPRRWCDGWAECGRRHAPMDASADAQRTGDADPSPVAPPAPLPGGADRERRRSASAIWTRYLGDDVTEWLDRTVWREERKEALRAIDRRCSIRARTSVAT